MTTTVTVRLGRYAAGAVLEVPDGQEVVVGRALSADLRVAGRQVSRRHLVVQPVGDGWEAVDISARGTWLDGQRVDRVPIDQERRFRLGAADGPEVIVAPAPPATTVALTMGGRDGDGLDLATVLGRPEAARPSPTAGLDWSSETESHPLRPGRMSIGRSRDNDIRVRDLLSSRHHAELVVAPRSLEIIDLESANGTFVNGQRVARATLGLGDIVSVGHHHFRVGAGVFEEVLDTGDATMRMIGES